MATKSQPTHDKASPSLEQRPAESAEAYVRALMAQGVECLFMNPGTDTIPIQEALSNTAQHSKATFVDFDLRVFPSHGVELRVRDNGQGFDPSGGPDGGIGLSGMAERARLVGGELTVTSSPGSGTRVRLYIPQ